MYGAVPLEAWFTDELEPQSHAIRQRLLAAADDDGRDEEFDFVDEARPEGVRRELVATDHQVMHRSQLHLANAVDVERLLEPRPRRRDLLQRLRVDDLVRCSPHPRKVARPWGIGFGRAGLRPDLHRLVHAPAVEMRADRTHHVVDELLALFVGGRPADLAL